VNDHKYDQPFSGWDVKVRAAYDFLFGTHPRQAQNLENLAAYLAALGAGTEDLRHPNHPPLGPADAPLAHPAGAIDVFKHEFGPNFLLTPLPWRTGHVTLAELCATSFPAPFRDVPQLQRHSEFVRTYPHDDPLQKRSYLYQILTLPLFRRGIPLG